MKIRDKKIKQMVDVSEEECPKFKCYWPRPNPGIFTQGQGYRSYGDERDKEWYCGNREIHGCPQKRELKEEQ